MMLTQSTPTLEIIPFNNPLDCAVDVPGSKSLTNRVLMIAALADGETKIANALFSDDSLYFARALQTLGIRVGLDPQNTTMTVLGLGGITPETQAELFIGNAGTAARFLTAFLTLGNGEYILDGDSRMRERPIGELVKALTQLGASIQVINHLSEKICPPIRINASGLLGGETKIAGDISIDYGDGY
jgi:3-phosphoshikimate 1-carboxyvinyltransferase